MLKRLINYKDFNGEEHTELFYFNFTAAEFMEWSLGVGLKSESDIETLIRTQDVSRIFFMVKSMILESYGVKTEDGRRFIKSDELRNEFEQSAAFSALFMELLTDEKKQTEFAKGVIPPDLPEKFKKIPAVAASTS